MTDERNSLFMHLKIVAYPQSDSYAIYHLCASRTKIVTIFCKFNNNLALCRCIKDTS